MFFPCSKGWSAAHGWALVKTLGMWETNDKRAESCFYLQRGFVWWGGCPIKVLFCIAWGWGSGSFAALWVLCTRSHCIYKRFPAEDGEGWCLLVTDQGSQRCSDAQCPAARARALVLGFMCKRWWYLSEYLKVTCCLYARYREGNCHRNLL